MIKVKVEGAEAKIVSQLISKALRDSGLRVNHWFDLAPRDVAGARRDAAREKADVSIATMRR